MGQSWPGPRLMLVDLHGSVMTLLLSPDGATTLQVIASLPRATPMRRTCCMIRRQVQEQDRGNQMRCIRLVMLLASTLFAALLRPRRRGR